MMPVAPQPAPTGKTLKTCIGKYRKQATTLPVATVWKNFRGSKCGKQWLDELHKAYGHRCLCCDHAEGRTIDHRDAKSLTVSGAFAWRNLRPWCGDCNNLKGTKTLVDPVSEDPRTFLVFDVTTGRPMVSPEAKPRQRKKAEDTRPVLDNQTLNEARRAKLHKVLDVMARFVAGEPGFGAARVISSWRPKRICTPGRRWSGGRWRASAA
jgi:hypothetical protein